MAFSTENLTDIYKTQSRYTTGGNTGKQSRQEVKPAVAFNGHFREHQKTRTHDDEQDKTEDQQGRRTELTLRQHLTNLPELQAHNHQEVELQEEHKTLLEAGDF